MGTMGSARMARKESPCRRRYTWGWAMLVEECHHRVRRAQDEQRQRQGYVQPLREEMTCGNDPRRRQAFSFPAGLGQHQEVPKEQAGQAAADDGPEYDQENRGQGTAHAERGMEI